MTPWQAVSWPLNHACCRCCRRLGISQLQKECEAGQAGAQREKDVSSKRSGGSAAEQTLHFHLLSLCLPCEPLDPPVISGTQVTGLPEFLFSK